LTPCLAATHFSRESWESVKEACSPNRPLIMSESSEFAHFMKSTFSAISRSRMSAPSRSDTS